MNNFSNGSVEYFCGVVVEAESEADVGVIETHVSPSSSLKKIPPLANLEQTFFAPLSKLSIEQIHSNSPKYKIQTRPKWDPKKRPSCSASDSLPSFLFKQGDSNSD